MGDFFDSLPRIIESGSQSVAAVIVLIVIALATAAFLMFRETSDRTKLMAFGGLLLVCIMVVVEATHILTDAHAPPAVSSDSAPVEQIAPPVSGPSFTPPGVSVIDRPPPFEPEIFDPFFPSDADPFARVEGAWLSNFSEEYVFDHVGDRLMFERYDLDFDEVTAQGEAFFDGFGLTLDYVDDFDDPGFGSFTFDGFGRLTGQMHDIEYDITEDVVLSRPF